MNLILADTNDSGSSVQTAASLPSGTEHCRNRNRLPTDKLLKLTQLYPPIMDSCQGSSFTPPGGLLPVSIIMSSLYQVTHHYLRQFSRIARHARSNTLVQPGLEILKL
jgi:hypothetical protein